MTAPVPGDIAYATDNDGTRYARVSGGGAHSYLVERDGGWDSIAADTTVVHPESREHVSVRDLDWQAAE